MSLINYVEPVGLGEAFMGLCSGLATLIVMCVLMYIIYRFYVKICQWFDIIINRDSKYAILESVYLDRIGKKKGIDLEKELVKRKMLENTKKKSIRKRIEDQIYEDMFGKEKEEKDNE